MEDTTVETYLEGSTGIGLEEVRKTAKWRGFKVCYLGHRGAWPRGLRFIPTFIYRFIHSFISRRSLIILLNANSPIRPLTHSFVRSS